MKWNTFLFIFNFFFYRFCPNFCSYPQSHFNSPMSGLTPSLEYDYFISRLQNSELYLELKLLSSNLFSGLTSA